MKKYSEVINKYNNKKYIVNTIPFNIVRKIAYDKTKPKNIGLIAQTAVFLIGKNIISGILTFFAPVITVNLADYSGISQLELHDLIYDLVENEDIEKLQLEDTYIKHKYFAKQESGFNVWQMKKKPIIFILSKL